MPKILIVIARMNKGGTSQYINELAKNLPKHGYEVLIATGYVQGLEIEDEVALHLPLARVEHLGRRVNILNDFKSYFEIKKLINWFKPDIIYSHTFKAGLLVRTIKTEIPIVHAFHGHLLDEPELAGFKVKVVTFIERKLASRARFLITVGKKVAHELLLAGVGVPEQYVSIPPGVKPLVLEDRQTVLKSLNLDEVAEPIVVWMARVVRVKGPERILELAKKIPKAQFVMAGGGDLLDSIRAQAPRNLAIVGWQPAEKMWAIADFAVSTSYNEGMPVALIEAQMAGLPVVALDVGSISEVIQHNRTGLVFHKFDEAFVDGVRKLITNASLYSKFCAESKIISRKEFSIQKLLTNHLNLFADILK